MKPTSQKKSFGNLSLSYKAPTPSSNQIVSSRKGSFQVFSRQGDKKSAVRGTGVAPAPTPLNTPSLKSENSGKDVLVSLVPVGSNAPVWSQQSDTGAQSKAASETARLSGAKPAPWTKPAEVAAAKPPPMRSWADDDSDDDPEDLARPFNRVPAQYVPSGGGGGYSDYQSGPGQQYHGGSAPSENQWGGSGRFNGGGYGDDFRGGGGYGRTQRDDRFSQDSRGPYQPNFGGGGYQDSRASMGDSRASMGDGRGGYNRFGSSGPGGMSAMGSGSFQRARAGSGDQRPRENSYDSPSDQRTYRESAVSGSNFGNSSSMQRGSLNGLPVAATLFGGAPDHGQSHEMDGAQEEQRAVELARMEREAILLKKKQQEMLEQQRQQAEIDRERYESREGSKYDQHSSSNRGGQQAQEISGSDFRYQNQRPTGPYRDTYKDNRGGDSRYMDRNTEFRTRQGSEGSGEGPDSWRRGSAQHHEEDGHHSRKVNGWGNAGVERMTSNNVESSNGIKIQQGTVHVMHRPAAASVPVSAVALAPVESIVAGNSDSATQPPHAIHQHPPAAAPPVTAPRPAQLYDPKTGAFYTTDRTPKATGKHIDDNNGKPAKVKSREKRGGSEDKIHHEPEESPAARKSREEAALRKSARDREKAARQPRSKGLLFRYTDEAKTVELIEQVITAEEEARKANDAGSVKGKRLEEKAETRRRKLKLQEEAKVRDLLEKKSGNGADKEDIKQARKISNDETPGADDSASEDSDNSSSRAVHDSYGYLVSDETQSKIFAEPLGHAGTVMVKGSADAFSLSESEALQDFTEVTRKKTKSTTGAGFGGSVPKIGLKRSRSDNNRSTNNNSPLPAGAPASANNVAKREMSQAPVKETVVTAAPLNPTPQVSLGLPAQPAWSAPRSTLQLVAGETVEPDPSSLQDMKKQRREEKIAAKNMKREKKVEELKKKKKDMKVARMLLDVQDMAAAAATVGLPTAGTSSKIASAEGTRRMADIAPALGSVSLDYNANSQQVQRRESNHGVYSTSRQGGYDSSILQDNEQNNAMSSRDDDGNSNVDDIHAVADTLPKRKLSSYQIFVPGKGLTNVPVSPDVTSGRPMDAQWNQQQGQQLSFSSGGGHRQDQQQSDRSGPAQGHLYGNSNNSNSRYSTGGNSHASVDSGAHWGVPGGEIDQFSADWGQQVEFIEGGETGRKGRHNPSSSRLQSWSGGGVNPSPDVGRAGNFFSSQDQQQQQHNSYEYRNHSNSQQAGPNGEVHGYPFTGAENGQSESYAFNAFDNTSQYHTGQVQRAPEVIHESKNLTVTMQVKENAFTSKKIGSFEDLDDQVIVRPDGSVEDGDVQRASAFMRGGRFSSRGRGRESSRGGGRGMGPAGRHQVTGGLYQHPHSRPVSGPSVVVSSEISAPATASASHPSSAGRGDDDRGGRGRGRGRGREKFDHKSAGRAGRGEGGPVKFVGKNEGPPADKPVPEKVHVDASGRGAGGRIPGGRGVERGGRSGGRGRGRETNSGPPRGGDTFPSASEPASTAAPAPHPPKKQGEGDFPSAQAVAAPLAAGRGGRGGRGAGRSSRGGRGVIARGPPAVPH